MRWIILLCLWCFALPAEPVVYRCSQGELRVYSDHPCAPEAQAAELPVLTELQGPAPRGNLSRDADARRQKEQSARNRADKAWLEDYRVRREREERIRSGLLNDEVVVGMNAAQVRQVWGAPLRATRQDKAGVVRERWTYRVDGETRNVNFKDGEVISASRQRKKKS